MPQNQALNNYTCPYSHAPFRRNERERAFVWSNQTFKPMRLVNKYRLMSQLKVEQQNRRLSKMIQQKQSLIKKQRQQFQRSRVLHFTRIVKKKVCNNFKAEAKETVTPIFKNIYETEVRVQDNNYKAVCQTSRQNFRVRFYQKKQFCELELGLKDAADLIHRSFNGSMSNFVSRLRPNRLKSRLVVTQSDQ